MEILILKQEIVEKLKNDLVLQGKIAQSNDMHIVSVQRWVAVNHKNLTTATNLSIIKEHYGYPTTMELVEAELQAPATA